MEHDPRWAHVTARIGEPDYDIEADWPPRGKFLEYLMEVRYNGRMYYYRQFITREIMTDLYWRDIEHVILNGMVHKIDQCMNEEEDGSQDSTPTPAGGDRQPQ